MTVVTRGPLEAAYLVVGSGCVVAGGIWSAVAASAPSEHSSWAVAYLVLVAGVAQIGLGRGIELFEASLPARSWRPAVEFAAWNIGNALVLSGVLAGVPALVDAGSVCLAVALVLALYGVRGAAVEGRRRWLLYLFRALVGVLLASTSIGVLLAHI